MKNKSPYAEAMDDEQESFTNNVNNGDDGSGLNVPTATDRQPPRSKKPTPPKKPLHSPPFSSHFESDHDDIQHALRYITWNDSFYNQEQHYDTLIAAFDINVDQQRHALLIHGMLWMLSILWCWNFGLDVQAQSAKKNYKSPEGLFVWFVVIPVVTALSVGAVRTHKEWCLVGRRHVAVTTKGICLDVSSSSSSSSSSERDGGSDKEVSLLLQLAQRQLIPFDGINTCSVQDNGWFRPSFYVSITTKWSSGVVGGPFAIQGLSKGQALVDLVKALREHDDTILRAAAAAAKKTAAHANANANAKPKTL